MVAILESYSGLSYILWNINLRVKPAISNPIPDIITLKGNDTDITKHPIKPRTGTNLPYILSFLGCLSAAIFVML